MNAWIESDFDSNYSKRRIPTTYNLDCEILMSFSLGVHEHVAKHKVSYRLRFRKCLHIGRVRMGLHQNKSNLLNS